MCHWLGLSLILSVTAAMAGTRDLPPPAPAGVDFSEQVEPILRDRCYACHGVNVQMNGLRLDERSHALKGGDSGLPSVIPGDSAQSLLIRTVAGLDPDRVMPKTGDRLTSEEIGLLRAWIDDGAPYAELHDSSPADGKDHWSFQPLTSPPVPEVKNADWVRNPIDAFVLAKLEERGWKPSPPAGNEPLLRRIYLDLIGLPPTPQEQQEFLERSSPEKFDRLIVELLDRPGYGERWGRHWLDVVRYAESNGYERDAIKPEVWKYRDYVIRSLNQDKPYDRFILEQLAGDELEDATAETHIALGFNRLGPWDDEPADFDQDRFDQLDDVVRTTSEAFLGLTMGCARCHDHKFDPLTQKDYYGMVALFNGLRRSQNGRREVSLPVGARAQLARQSQRDDRIKELEGQIDKLREDFRIERLRSGRSGLPENAVAALLEDAKKRTEEQKRLAREYSSEMIRETAAALSPELVGRIAALEAEIAVVRRSTSELDRGYYLYESKPPEVVHVLMRGRAASPGEVAVPCLPTALVPSQPEFSSKGNSSGRRLALARWIASPENPLTARVLANRVWQQHLGHGLVRTGGDFGIMGDRPSHPELLDWLASRFIQEGWSLKKLHTLIMTSNTYRMDKTPVAEYLEADPENRFLWRAHYRRLEAEAIRDSMLAASGQLNRKMYGPSMVPPIPEAALEGHPDPDKIWHTSNEREASRRTVYAFVKRSMLIPMLEVLDFCDTTRSSAQRPVTSIAPQALTLFNGDFANAQALHLARRVLEDAGPNPVEQVDLVYRLALSRRPTPDEHREMVDFLNQETEARLWETSARNRDRLVAREESLVQLCRVVFNLNEFVYPN